MGKILLLIVLAMSPVLIPELGNRLGMNAPFNNSTGSWTGTQADDRAESIHNAERRSQEERSYAMVGAIVVGAFLIGEGLRKRGPAPPPVRVPPMD